MRTLSCVLRIVTAFCAFRLLTTASLCHAQAWDGREIIPVAPDAWNFMKYGGNTTPDLYTGTLHLSIPLYTYMDSDFEIPLSLDYTTTGFMPNTTTGTTGMGWTLNAGGCISREVRQRPDGAGDGVYGSLEYCIDTLTRNPFDRTPNLLHNETGMFCYVIPKGSNSWQKNVESEPDVFSFKFNGHSGKFILVRVPVDGQSYSQVQAFVYGTAKPAGEYRVDVKHSGDDFLFTIVTGDGFKYHFDRMEGQDYCTIQKRPWGGGEDDSSVSDTPVSWSLVSIEAPNGRKVRFTYKLFPFAMSVKPSVSQGVVHYRRTDLHDTWLKDFEEQLNNFHIASHNIYASNYAVLDSVIVDDAGVVIKNMYSNRPKTEFQRLNDGITPDSLRSVKKLDSIVIRDVLRNRPLRTISFFYKHPLNSKSNPVLMLKDVHISGEGDYVMDYNDEDGAFPFQGTTSVDHWGYYNGRGRYYINDFLPKISLDKNLVQTVTNDAREPDFSGSVMGTLRKIRYPAGGYTRFEYEQHQYSVVLTRDLSSKNLPYLKSIESAPAGGVRIRKIIDHPLTSDSTVRTYTYEKQGLSSGLVLRYPQYYQIVAFEYEGADKMIYEIAATRASYGFYAHTQDASYICYPDVSETTSNGAVTKYHFSSYSDPECRDLFPNEKTEMKTVDEGANYNPWVYAAYLDSDSRDALRGKLLRKESYAKDQSQPWSVERYKYKVQGPTPPYCACVKNAISKLYVSKNYLDNCLVDESSCTYFEGRDSLMIHKKYSYNRLNQQTGVCTTDYGLKTSKISECLYLDDIVSDSDPIHRYMKEMNVVQFPVKTLTAFFGATDPGRIGYELTDGTYYEFQKNGNMICVGSVKKAKIPPAGNILSPFCGFDFDHLLITAASYRYNNKNYPVEIRNRAGRPTCIVWGYNGLYPVAEIENCSLYVFQEILLSYHQDGIFNAGLPDYLQYVIYQRDDMEMTTYDYIPHVGVTCIQDPAERRTYYEYDRDGRLSRIADDKLQLLKAFKYHVKNQ